MGAIQVTNTPRCRATRSRSAQRHLRYFLTPTSTTDQPQMPLHKNSKHCKRVSSKVQVNFKDRCSQKPFQVAIRVRPFNQRELTLGTARVVTIPSPSQTTLVSSDGKKKEKTFTFDSCFDSIDPSAESFSSQEDVFRTLGTDILDNAFNGYNACVFAYGQTGSGGCL